MLSWVAAGMSEQEILDDHPDLERGGFRAVSDFAAHMRGGSPVKLLFDENLFSRFPDRLSDLYPGSSHETAPRHIRVEPEYQLQPLARLEWKKPGSA